VIFLVTNEKNNDTSTVTHIKPLGNGRKRKLRRVRSLIRSSIEKLTTDQEQTAKKSAANIPLDKRPFPFGHW
jgi:hypothetical protein